MACDNTGLPNASASVSLCDPGSAETTPSQQDLKKWAELVAAFATQGTQPVPPQLPPQATPEAWRADVEALTPSTSRSEASQAAQEALGQSLRTSFGSSDESELNRIQVRLNAGDLGELSLVVERSLTGLRVQIGAQNTNVLAEIARSGSAMTQALTTAGQTVTSLTFVPMDSVGINLARAKEGSGNKARSEAAMSTDESSNEERRRKNHQLDVLG